MNAFLVLVHPRLSWIKADCCYAFVHPIGGTRDTAFLGYMSIYVSIPVHVHMRLWMPAWRHLPGPTGLTLTSAVAPFLSIARRCDITVFRCVMQKRYIQRARRLQWRWQWREEQLSTQTLVSFITFLLLTSVLWRCRLGGRKGIRPVENWVVGCLCGYLSGVRCRPEYGPADATATLSLASIKSGLVLPFWYRLTWVKFPDKGPLNVCVCLTTGFFTMPPVLGLLQSARVSVHLSTDLSQKPLCSDFAEFSVHVICGQPHAGSGA